MKKEKDIFEKLEENEWITCVSHDRDFPIGNVDELNPNYDHEFVEWKQKLHDKFHNKKLVKKEYKCCGDFKAFRIFEREIQETYKKAYQYVFDEIKAADFYSDDEIHDWIKKNMIFVVCDEYDPASRRTSFWIEPQFKG